MKQRLLIQAMIISDNDGRFLVDLIRNKTINVDHLSAFIGALKMFGEEQLGAIKDISINGLDIDLLIVSKYNLIMIAIMDSDVPQLDFRAGCERALETFNKIFHDKIESWDGSLDTFRDFRELLEGQVKRYFEELGEIESMPVEMEAQDIILATKQKEMEKLMEEELKSQDEKLEDLYDEFEMETGESAFSYGRITNEFKQWKLIRQKKIG